MNTRMSALGRVARVTALVVLIFALYYGSYKIPNETKLTSRLSAMINEAITDLFILSDYLGFGDPMLRLRGTIKSLKSSVPEGVLTQDFTFDGVPVRVYTPKDATPDGAGVVFFHGGGWVLGTLDMYNALVGDITKATGVVMVSIDYRLAPEHKFPEPFDDCVKATNYFLAHAAEFGVDPGRVGVAGDSAGGNLAAAVALKLKDQLRAQVLIYPALQAFDFNTPSYQVTGPKGLLLRRPAMISFWLYYALGSRDHLEAAMLNKHTPIAVKEAVANIYVKIDSMSDEYIPNEYVKPKLRDGNLELWQELQATLMNPYFAPLAAKDVTNVPPALVITSEYDVLRDDGVLYAQKLKQEGIKVSHYHAWDGTHGMMSIPGRGNSGSADKMFNFICSFIRNSL